MYKPLFYPEINTISGMHLPSAYHTKNTLAFDWWTRAFYERLINGLKITTPWDGDVKDFFHYCLYGYGYVAIFDIPEFGLSFQPCSLSGYDFYYRPTDAIVSNPLLNRRFKIGEDCTILKLTPDYLGVFDIIYYYAEKMAELDCALKISIFNEKNPKIFAARSKAAAESLKKIMDKVNQGNAVEVYDTRLFEKNDELQEDFEPLKMLEGNSKDMYMTDKILQDMQTVLNRFDNEIGIPTVPYQKKERMVTDEANSTQIDSQSRILTWYETLTSSIEVIKKMFPDIELSVEKRWTNNVSQQNDDDRNVSVRPDATR